MAPAESFLARLGLARFVLFCHIFKMAAVQAALRVSHIVNIFI